MSAVEFWDMSPVEYYYAMKDYNETQMRGIKTTYEAMRLQTWFLVTSRTNIPSPEKLMTFSWEEKPIQSIDEMKQALLSIAKHFKKKKK